MTTPEQIAKAMATLRDELTEMNVGPRIYPMACDVFAVTPALCNRLAAILKDQTNVR